MLPLAGLYWAPTSQPKERVGRVHVADLDLTQCHGPLLLTLDGASFHGQWNSAPEVGLQSLRRGQVWLLVSSCINTLISQKSCEAEGSRNSTSY